MKVTIHRKELTAALAGLGHVVTQRTTIPVIKCVLFHVMDGKLVATATDLDQSATFRGFTCVPQNNDAIAIPMARLKRAMVLCDANEITVETFDDCVTRLTGGSLRMKLFGLQSGEFPLDRREPIPVLPAGDFVEKFRTVSATASTDEIRDVLNGVCWTKEGELAATDGRRLSMLSGVPAHVDAAIVRHTRFLLRAKLGDDIHVGSAFTKSGTVFALTSSLWTYRTKTIYGTFPNWRMVIPNAEPNAVFTIPDAAVKRLCARLSTIATKHGTPFELTGTPDGALVFKTNDPDDGEAEITVKADPVKCGPSGFRIALNPAFFVTALQQGFTQWKWTDDISPMKATRADGSGVHVLMPMRMR